MPPAPQEPETFVTESTALLQATVSTASFSSQNFLQNDESELELESLSSRQSNETRANKGDNGCISKFLNYCQMTNFLSLGIFLTVFLLGPFFRAEPGASSQGSDATGEPLPFGDPFPFSILDPIGDVGLPKHGRSKDDPSFPSFFYDEIDKDWHALPTNAWYQNMLQAPQNGEPSNLQRAYTIPYLIDVVGIIPGLRIHATDIDASDMVIQLNFNEWFGLVLGATAYKGDSNAKSATSQSHQYKVLATTELGITLQWNAMKMTSNIVKGMSFVTMEYQKEIAQSEGDMYPTIATPFDIQDPILVDGNNTVDCSGQRFLVENDIELYIRQSDYTWMVFVSEPVWMQCSLTSGKTFIQVVDYGTEDPEVEGNCEPSSLLIMRAALVDQCTNGSNPASCRQGIGHRLGDDEPMKKDYVHLLRAHADFYPGRDTSFSYRMSENADNATLLFDWDTQNMSGVCRNRTSLLGAHNQTDELLAFALPHQLERLSLRELPNQQRYCKSSLSGPVCLVQGNRLAIPQELPTIGFTAKRPPRPEYIPTIAKALLIDLDFKIPEYFRRGAGDTYFSGKILAKLARILLIAQELMDICDTKSEENKNSFGRGDYYAQFCKNSTLPSVSHIEAALEELRGGVQVWIDGTADTPFVYDTSWGGVVSCGCYMEGTECTNQYPNCPAFADPGLNFGNGFYNDHHFHYGYHIFAAAVVSHFDQEWGMDYFEKVLLLVRDIANPSEQDIYFPLFRHKDWYQGSSWASGVPYPAYLNGKNQESSSEAIAAYEGVALFGQVMHGIWEEKNNARNVAVSKQIANVGRLMTGTELSSAQRYWHISESSATESNEDKNLQRIYPEQYNKNVIGILWQTMAQFGTWFGSAEYLPIGIQLLPLTPISEDRDTLDWMNAIYKPFTYACATDFVCTESGWAILQLATLATIGYVPEAAIKVKELPNESFENAGGNGESRSNTLWYISTRPEVTNRIPMVAYDKRGQEEVGPKVLYELKDCHLPETCIEEVLNREAGEYTCRVRIAWLIYEQNLSQWEACRQVAGIEFPETCGPCDPGTKFTSNEKRAQEIELQNTKSPIRVEPESTSLDVSSSLKCPPCTEEECNSDLNRCPVYKRTFVCTEGTSKGGCSGELKFWIEEDQCNSCCEMTHCLDLKDKEAKKFTKDGNALTQNSCPPCNPDICYGKLNRCPIHTAPYLCTEGKNIGGCASSPWSLSDNECGECCELKLDC